MDSSVKNNIDNDLYRSIEETGPVSTGWLEF